MAAFDRARSDGADGIELDVQLDGDGTVVVFHDDTLDRLVGRPGTLSELSTLERKELRVSGHPLPTLEEVLGELGELECNVEIKSAKLARESALVKAFECPEPALINVKIGGSDFRKGSISEIGRAHV